MYASQGSAPSRGRIIVVALSGIAILAAYIGFTMITLPTPAAGQRILSINISIFDATTQMLATDWTRLFWPMEYEPGRIYWIPTTLLPTYAAERYLGPLASYLLFSCLFISTAFTLAFSLTRSLLFSSTLAFLFAFGTQINYVYTYGSLIPLYLLLTYIAVNLAIVVLLLRGRFSQGLGLAAFVATLFVIALSSEWWINYAVALTSAASFGFVWAFRHRHRQTMRVCGRVVGSTLAMLALYLLVRLQFPSQFFRLGEEEELLLTYSSPILMIEDLVTNFFTLLYMSLANYLPSFVTSSNSLTHVGPELILSEQHGYHARYQNLVLMNHLFLWRFYAGVAVTIFIAFQIRSISQAWHSPEWSHVIIAVLMLMVMTGFTTHLAIKMRPYNSVAGLPYKVAISVSALSVLIAHLVTLAYAWLKSNAARRILVVGVWACIFAAALTRPGMQLHHLAQVGLIGYRDPWAQLLSLW